LNINQDIRNPDLQVNNSVDNGQAPQVEGHKMVKTYEFHLPMHHIREEEPRQQMDLQKTGLNNSRYPLSKQGTMYRLITKRKTGFLQKRDDISSQNLEIETGADQQGSFKNLNFAGSYCGDNAVQFNQSQTSIRKKATKSKRS